MEILGESGAKFQSLSEPWANTTTHAGKMIMTVFAGIAEFERDLIRERTAAGRHAAKSRGVQFGRPRKLNDDQLRLAAELLNQGKSVRGNRPHISSTLLDDLPLSDKCHLNRRYGPITYHPPELRTLNG
jgi:DNA invertase Pin-like site-specific DNA recombinase